MYDSLGTIDSVASTNFWNGSKHVIQAFDLMTGLHLWEQDTSESYSSPFSDSKYFYVWSADGKYYNRLERWLPDGTFAGYLYITVDEYETNYKSPVLTGLNPSRTHFPLMTVNNGKLYWATTYPDYRGSLGTLPGGGGLMMIDLAHVQPGLEANEYTTKARLVFPRTNNQTNYDEKMIFFQRNQKNYVVFAETFQTYGEINPYNSDGNPNLAFCAANVGIHCVDLDSGVELWKYVDPWAPEFVRVFLWNDSIIESGNYRSARLNIDTGLPIWQNPVGTGNQGGISYTFDGSTMFVNKADTNAPFGLESVDLSTGKRNWARYQYATQGYGLAEKDQVLYVINQTAIRLYNAATGEYLAIDDSVVPIQGQGEPNLSFVWHNPADGSDNLIVYGDVNSYSLKMNYHIDLFGKLTK